MPISRFCATEFKPRKIGYLYTLRMPDDGSIFYVGQTKYWKTRYNAHLADGRSASCDSEKGLIIRNLLNAGKKPVMALIESVEIRTPYDSNYYNHREFYWIRNYLEYGWNLSNIRINDVLSSELSYKKIIETARNGGNLPISDFYFGNDSKGFGVYDIKKIHELGYHFTEDQFASHWAYVNLHIERYSEIRESTLDYVYSDIHCKENYNENWADFL